MRRALSGERGAAAVEAAIVLPVMILLAGGAVDFARAYRAQVQIRNAVQEGASFAALQPGSVTDTGTCAGGNSVTERTLTELIPAGADPDLEAQIRSEITVTVYLVRNAGSNTDLLAPVVLTGCSASSAALPGSQVVVKAQRPVTALFLQVAAAVPGAGAIISDGKIDTEADVRVVVQG